MLALDVSFFLSILLLFFPFMRGKAVLVVDPQNRYDERDIMFARARYVRGTPQYRDYYSRRPERKKIDDAIRAMPKLLSPGGKYYDPVRSAIAKNYFEINKKLASLVEGRPADKKKKIEPIQATRLLKDMARKLGAVDAGIARLNPAHVYSYIGRSPGRYGIPVNLKHHFIFVFAVEMDFKAMVRAPQLDVVIESSQKYLEAAKIAIAIASYIRSIGYEARAHVDTNYRLMLPAAAVDAGLGEVGRLGILIHPRYGARVRLGAVSTDLPLNVDEPITFAVQQFCGECKKCARNCPAGAISSRKSRNVRGVVKWSTNQAACYRYWREVGTDCGICMRVCPYSKPNNFVHNVIRFAATNSPLSRKLSILADDLFYGKKIRI
ncbi:MAG: reductive dehalogenase [Calditrichaeota bacterium]|nr:reductive dehalogenase [Calditrichota bacterium]